MTELTGTDGGDVLNVDAGVQIVNAGLGDDIINISFPETVTINGGTGTDTVRLDIGAITGDTSGSFFSAFPFFPTLNDFPDFDELLGISDFNTGTELEFNSIERVELFNSVTGNELIVFQTFSAGDDVINITNEQADLVVVLGGDGNDTIFGRDGAVPAFPGLVNGSLFGGNGNDIINGGDGEEFIRGDAGSDVLTGGDGADTFGYLTFEDTLSIGFSDIITDFSEDDIIVIENPSIFGEGDIGFLPVFINENPFSGLATGSELRSFTSSGQTFLELDIDGDGAVDETLTISSGEFDIQVISTSDGRFELGGVLIPIVFNEVINGSTGDDVLTGNSDNDTINGKAGDDIIFGNDGDDVLNGGAGDDTLNGGAGEDVLTGASGNDTINAGTNDDDVNGGGGDDTINGGAGDDILFGSIGEDVINGGAGDDTLNGGSQNDMLFGNSGDDTLIGGSGNDSLDGGGGNDALVGGAGADALMGGAGADTLEGNAGGDDLFGGNGNDTLFGGGGNDDLYGEAGADTFVFTAAIGVDRIKDFEDGIDTIDLSGFVLGNDFADIMDVATQVGANVRIDFNANNSIILEGFDISDLDGMDFVF